MKSRAVLFLYTALAAFALAAALPGCGGKSSDAAKAPDARADAPVPVATVPVKVMPVQREVKFVGTLEAYEESAVSSNLAAPVARVYVDMGDRVVKGQTLAKLDDEEYRIKVRLAEAALREALAKLGVEDEESLVIEKVSYVKKAKAELDDAERSLGRMKELSGKGYVAKAQLDEAQARRDVAGAALDSQHEYGRSLFSSVKTKRAALELAKKELRDTEVKAPIGGYVSRRTVDPGDYVKAGGEMIGIVRVDPVRLRGEIPEVNAPDIRPGMEVRLKMAAVPGREYRGRISRISPASSRESRAFTVEALIPNADSALKPGYFAEAGVLTRVDQDAVTVPIESLVLYAGVTKVFIVKDGTARERAVKPGSKVGGQVEVAGEVRPGDMVVVSGMSRLFDGMAVSAKESR